MTAERTFTSPASGGPVPYDVPKNGTPIVKIGRKGKLTFILGEDGAPFTVDVVAAYYDYLEVDRSFRDEKDEVPPDRQPLLTASIWNWVKECARTGSGNAEDCTPSGSGNADNCTLAEALEFVKRLTEEYLRLRDFFAINLPAKQSSPEASETLRFST